MKSKKHNIIKKSQNELTDYRNMAKTPIEDIDTEEKNIFASLQGTNEISHNDGFNENDEEKIQKAPILYRAEEWIERYIPQLIIGGIFVLFSWTILLQIGQARTEEKINYLEEKINKLDSIISDKYLMKDIYEIQIENFKNKDDELKQQINDLKNELNTIKK